MDARWPNQLSFRKKINYRRLVEELEAVAGLGPEPDELENIQAGFRIDLLDDENGFEVSFRGGVADDVVTAVVRAHTATPDPEPEPAPRPIEVLNEGIQAAANMADVKKVFADFAERFGDRL